MTDATLVEPKAITLHVTVMGGATKRFTIAAGESMLVAEILNKMEITWGREGDAVSLNAQMIDPRETVVDTNNPPGEGPLILLVSPRVSNG